MYSTFLWPTPTKKNTDRPFGTFFSKSWAESQQQYGHSIYWANLARLPRYNASQRIKQDTYTLFNGRTNEHHRGWDPIWVKDLNFAFPSHGRFDGEFRSLFRTRSDWNVLFVFLFRVLVVSQRIAGLSLSLYLRNIVLRERHSFYDSRNQSGYSKSKRSLLVAHFLQSNTTIR